jgi:hypothetical protein
VGTHFKALTVVMIIALMTFALLERVLPNELMGRDDIRRLRAIWISTTLLLFLTFNFWVFVVTFLILLAFLSFKERIPVHVYLLLMVAVPAVDQAIPGFGPIDRLLEVSALRVLTVAILVPQMIRIIRSGQSAVRGVDLLDVTIVMFLGWSFVMQLVTVPLTPLLTYLCLTTSSAEASQRTWISERRLRVSSSACLCWPLSGR